MMFKSDYVICGLLIAYICSIPYLPKNFILLFDNLIEMIEPIPKKRVQKKTLILIQILLNYLISANPV